jgi:hypothetical protein
MFFCLAVYVFCRADDIFEKCVEQLKFKQIDFEQMTPSHIIIEICEFDSTFA